MERRYAMTKMSEGDGWLLLSNDARHLYRLAKYDEDGSAYWTDEDGKDHPITGTFWCFLYLTADGERDVVRRDADGTISGIDLRAARVSWSWDVAELMFPTRKAAEIAALQHGEVRS